MRRFLLAGLLAATAWGSATPASAAERKLVFLAEPGDAEAESAARAAMDEVLTQAKFLGIEYDLQITAPDQLSEHPEALAVFVAGDPADAEAAAEQASDTAVFNVASSDDALRTRCRENLFHTPPSEKMLADAEAQWKQARPDDSGVEARAWHPAFVKFAARDLNNRWKEATRRPMTNRDWAIWVAVRLVGDAIANNQDASSEELIAYFRKEMEFDGQKGDYLTFRETGQLRQPVLVTVEGELAGEAPVRGVSSDLDSLGLQACR